MSKAETFYANSLFVTTFLGGITFAAMILLIQVPNDFLSRVNNLPPYYLRVLITGAAMTSIFLIVASVGMIRVAAKEKTADHIFSNFMNLFATIGYIGLLTLFPLLLYPFKSPDPTEIEEPCATTRGAPQRSIGARTASAGFRTMR